VQGSVGAGCCGSNDEIPHPLPNGLERFLVSRACARLRCERRNPADLDVWTQRVLKMSLSRRFDPGGSACNDLAE